MTQIQHRSVETNGIRMHIAEQGTGPLVVLCHGLPESWSKSTNGLDRIFGQNGINCAPNTIGR